MGLVAPLLSLQSPVRNRGRECKMGGPRFGVVEAVLWFSRRASEIQHMTLAIARPNRLPGSSD